MFFDKGRDFIPREPEQGTNDLKTVRVGHCFHSRQPSRPRSAKKVEEAGFDLIISVVAEKNTPAAMCLCTGLEERRIAIPGQPSLRKASARLHDAALQPLQDKGGIRIFARWSRRARSQPLRRGRASRGSDDKRSASCNQGRAGKITASWNRAHLIPRRGISSRAGERRAPGAVFQAAQSISVAPK